jgi:hypothetical protein
VNFTARNGQAEAANDFTILDRDVQIFDDQLLHIGPEI